MKKLFAIMLALTLLLGSAAMADDVDLRQAAADAGYTDGAMEILWFANPLCQKEPEEIEWIQQNEAGTGIKFNWTKVNSESATEKLAMILTSDKLPDIIWNGLSKEMLVQYINQDVFMPVEDLIENYMPNLKKILDENPSYKASIIAPDGHIYGFPYIEEMDGLVLTPGPMLIYKPWLDQLGLEMPKTIDEFHEVLKAFKAAGDLNGNGVADEIPYALCFDSNETFGSCNTFHMLTGCFGQADSARGAQDDHLSPINGVVTYTAIDEAYRETCKFYHELWTEGLLDPDSFSPEVSSGNPLYYDKLKGDLPILGVCSVWTRSDVISNEELRAGYVPLPRLEGPNGKMGFVLNFSEMQYNCNAVITADCKYPELVARWIDNCYDLYNSLFLNWGPLDVRYAWANEEHTMVDALSMDLMPPEYSVWPEWRVNITPLAGPCALMTEIYSKMTDKSTIDAVNEYLADQIANGKREWQAEMEAMPQGYLAADEQNRAAQIQPQLENIVNQYTMTWILDGGADEQWDKYVSDLKAAGLDEFVAIYQAAYDRGNK